MGQNGALTNELDAKIRDAINQHLPEVVSAVISMVNNQRPSAPRDVQPQELRDNERLNEPGNYSNVVSSNTHARPNRLTDTNVNIGLGLDPNPLVSFSTTGQPVAQPVQSNYRPVEGVVPHTSGDTGRDLGSSTLPRVTTLTLGGTVGQPSQHLTPALLAPQGLGASLGRGMASGGELSATTLSQASPPYISNFALPMVFGIPEGVKKRVWAGKHVPLCMFLPGYYEQDCQRISALVPTIGEGGNVTLTFSQTDQERKLSKRPLTPQEFSTAFLRYKQVVLERFPRRADELDAYVLRILNLASTYTGLAYWHYHSLFSHKAATLWDRGYKVDWSVCDPELLHAAIASQKANFCDHCQHMLHSTSQCPFSMQKESKPSPPSLTQPPKSNRVYYKGEEICNNFNFGTCKLTDCKYLHCCRFCQKNHSVKDCKKAPK